MYIAAEGLKSGMFPEIGHVFRSVHYNVTVVVSAVLPGKRKTTEDFDRPRRSTYNIPTDVLTSSLEFKYLTSSGIPRPHAVALL
jgi:hypothetical protein